MASLGRMFVSGTATLPEMRPSYGRATVVRRPGVLGRVVMSGLLTARDPSLF
ncbi:unnamed protein product [[Actinomadura] parvosata subsp. kistnae]|nr:unnamed protein product [Actinomadura parvosata subsp. kistnae]